MSPAAVEDLHDILLQCKEKYRFSRFVFLCGSMGGTGALIFAVRYPELVHGLGIMGAASDIGRYREFCLQSEFPILREIGNTITENYPEKDYVLHNVCANFDRLTMPMVFYHGKDDVVIPVSELTELQ